MEPYAVVETGGKQYMVKAGDTLEVELLGVEPGKQAVLDRVLAVSDGKQLTIGAPTVNGAKVTVDVVKSKRGPKLVSFQKRRRKGSSRKVGHRQDLTVVKVASVA